MSRELNLTISKEHSQQRIDTVIAKLMPEISRSQIQKWVKNQSILLNGQTVSNKHVVYQGDIISGKLSQATQIEYQPQELFLDIIYQDDNILVINKPLGLVVHPGAGNPDNTLLNGLLFHFPELQHVPRAGIVHRLDKDTSGLMVVAKTIEAQYHLVNQLQQRSVKRIYIALVNGEMISGKTIQTHIGRSGNNRVKMQVTPKGIGKEAITHCSIEKKYYGLTLIKCQLETGRTHQIRVHMSHIRHSLVGDTLYSSKKQLSKKVHNELKPTILSFPRQALHAQKLSFIHPKTHQQVSYFSELPKDFSCLLNDIEKYE